MTDSEQDRARRQNSQETPVSAQEGDHKGPAVSIPPPLVFVAFLVVGLVLHLVWPVRLTDSLLLRFAGATLCVLAIVALLAIGLMFHKHQTSIAPWEPTTRVLDHGPYAFSRNPIYVAFCFLAIGIGLSQNSLWMSLSFIPSAFVVFHTAIVREEEYLEKKFGEQYRRYKAKSPALDIKEFLRGDPVKNQGTAL